MFEDISPGQYAIEATVDGHGTAETGVDLESGANEEISVTLPDEEEVEESETEQDDDAP